MVKTPLSVIIITKNEEKNLEKCLLSLRDLPSEIILVDSGSTDKTLEIAKKWQVKIFHKKFSGFGFQKNFALSKASYDWVLSVDADERMSKSLYLEIKKALNASFDGFYIPCLSNFLGKWIRHAGWYPQYKLRLFKKSKMKFEEKLVHEEVKPKGRIGYLKNPILHYSYPTLKEYLRKLEIYTALEAHPSLNPLNFWTVFNLFLKPVYRFSEMYIFNSGFLDGWRGFLLSILSSYYEFKVQFRLLKRKI